MGDIYRWVFDNGLSVPHNILSGTQGLADTVH